ncbi:MAG: MBL fold metallo-hydrolase [Ruminococcaceae bacterium]|nr:MBL fold metallo-hydrolase [Oscillospiraceae bacterium]
MIKFCSLYSGSSGNSIYFGTEQTHILIDAGVSGARITKALQAIDVKPEAVGAILITHEHSDHTIGAGIFSRKYGVPIYAREKTWKAMRRDLGKLADENIVIIDKENFTVGDVKVCNYSIPHDAADPVAYTFYTNNKKVAIATDIGCITEDICKNVLGSDIALIESNHDIRMLQNSRYPWHLKQRILSDHGHLSNAGAAAFITELAKSGTRHIYMGHLSRENNYPELVMNTAKCALSQCGFDVEKDVHICVASREHYSEVTEI